MEPVEGRALRWLLGNPEVRSESGTLLLAGQLDPRDLPIKNDELILYEGRTWRVLETGMRLVDGRSLAWVRLADPDTVLP